MGVSERTTRRKILSGLAAAGIALAGIAGISSGVNSCAGPAVDTKPRPLTDAEANRLASMRLHNHTDGRVGIRGTVGPPGRQTQINGWIDWQRPMAYLALDGPGPNTAALVQAVPGVLAVRPGRIEATPPASADPASPAPTTSASNGSAQAPSPGTSTSPSGTAVPEPGWDGPDKPPQHPPADGWRIRPVSLDGEAKSPLDNLLAFLFLIARDQPDKADLLLDLQTQWVRRDNIAGAEVDVLLGPAVIPLSGPQPDPTASPSASQAASPSASAAAPSLASPSASGAIFAPARLESVSPAATEPGSAAPSQVDPSLDPSADPSQDPSDSPTPTPADPASLDAHGGAVGYWLDDQGRLRKLELVLGVDLPAVIDVIRTDRTQFAAVDGLGGRTVSAKKVSRAEAELLARMRQRNLEAVGGQLSITLPAMPGTLRTAKGWLDWRSRVAYLSVRDLDDPGQGVLVHADRFGVALRTTGAKTPNLPPLPAPRDRWERTSWVELSSSTAATDLDFLLYEVLTLAAPVGDDVATIRKNARRLRLDILHGVPVGVFELPGPLDQGLPAGAARLRYWIDNGGVLRRLEIRTATGGLAQLDLDPSRQASSLPASVG